MPVLQEFNSPSSSTSQSSGNEFNSNWRSNQIFLEPGQQEMEREPPPPDEPHQCKTNTHQLQLMFQHQLQSIKSSLAASLIHQAFQKTIETATALTL